MSKQTRFDVSLAVVFFAGVLSEHWWISIPMVFAGMLSARVLANDAMRGRVESGEQG